MGTVLRPDHNVIAPLDRVFNMRPQYNGPYVTMWNYTTDIDKLSLAIRDDLTAQCRVIIGNSIIDNLRDMTDSEKLSALLSLRDKLRNGDNLNFPDVGSYVYEWLFCLDIDDPIVEWENANLTDQLSQDDWLEFFDSPDNYK